MGEGAYVFNPEWEGPNGETQYAYQYSNLDSNVVFQQGINVDQYTILFNNETTKEQAVVKIRFSPQFFEEIIEFEVELNSIKYDKNMIGKDIIVNWKFYDNFDPKGKFYTDSNSLAMIERNVN